MREVGNPSPPPSSRRETAGRGRSCSSIDFGPEELEPFRDNDIGPHPHIGLSTVT